MTDTSNMTPDMPQGPGGEDRDTRIAEYALGTLTGDARKAFEAELARDESLRRAVAVWSERLQPLADSVDPVAPPLALRDRVLTRIGETQGDTAPFSILRWLAWTFGASAVGAAIAVAAVFLLTPQPTRLAGYAMLHDQAGGPGVVVVQMDKTRQQLVLLAETQAAGADKDYELWVLPSGKAPVSLGVLPAAERVERPIDSMRATLIEPGATLAVSLESKGGSTTGAPIGPVIFVGTFHLPPEGQRE
jgi:anti-sigma-K factor RskA